MYEETPNKEYIDRWLEKMQDRYEYKNLKQMSKGRLEGMEFEVERHFLVFKSGFPPEESAIQGGRRAFVFDNPNETKETLTSAEKERLRQSKSDLHHEIYRAQGYREEKRREHRSELVNSISDIVNGINQSMLAIWATVKELTPW